MFSQGDEGKSWYIIMKGSVNVVISGKVSQSNIRTTLLIFLPIIFYISWNQVVFLISFVLIMLIFLFLSRV